MLCYFITIFINFPPVQNTIPFHGIPKCTHIFAMFLLCIHIFTISGLSLAVLCAFRTFKGGTHTFVCRHFSLYHSIARIFMFINYSFFRFLLYSKWNSMRWYVRIGWIIFRWNGLHSILFPKRMKLCSFQIRFRWCNRLWLFLCTHAPDINWKLFKLFTQFSRLQCGESTFEIPSTLPPSASHASLYSLNVYFWVVQIKCNSNTTFTSESV